MQPPPRKILRRKWGFRKTARTESLNMETPRFVFYFQSLITNLANLFRQQKPADDILNAHWSLQPPRYQTQIRSPQDLRKAVTSALSYNGSASPGTTKGPQVPTFLPFSGNFVLDKSFTLAEDTNPLLEKVHGLNPTRGTECATIAQQLVNLVAEVDGFKYIKQGTGSPLQGSRTVTGWYFHYVCEASEERIPS